MKFWKSAILDHTEIPKEPLDPEADYQTWIPGHPIVAQSLHFVLAGHAYLIYAEEDFNSILTGRPYVPRIDWIPSESSNAVNLVGFRVSDSVTFGPYLWPRILHRARMRRNKVPDVPRTVPESQKSSSSAQASSMASSGLRCRFFL
jgi:hypothetical protein